jgi:small subunit ribosomal protein S4
VPAYLDARLADLAVRVVRQPVRHEVPITCDVSKVVEFYAR